MIEFRNCFRITCGFNGNSFTESSRTHIDNSLSRSGPGGMTRISTLTLTNAFRRSNSPDVVGLRGRNEAGWLPGRQIHPADEATVAHG